MVGLRAAVCVACILLSSGCSKRPSEEDGDARVHDDCLATVRNVLGKDVQLLRYGHFAAGAPLDAVAASNVPDILPDDDGAIVSRLIVVRREQGKWNVVLDAAERILNPEGLVIAPDIDDALSFTSYRLVLLDKAPDGGGGLTIWLWRRGDAEDDESSGIELGLNRRTGRYQNFDYQVTQAYTSEVRTR